MSLLDRAHPAWGRFLANGGEAAVPALEEFLFDLSYEEILRARGAGKAGAQPSEVQPPTAQQPAGASLAGEQRSNKTIEEMLLSYLLSGEKEAAGLAARLGAGGPA
jgi:hypothetical protein